MPLLEVSREGWKAKPPSAELTPLEHPLHSVFVTYTNTEACKGLQECSQVLQELQNSHQAAGEPDIKYSFMVGGDGRVYEGRGWTGTTCPPLAQPCQHKSLIVAKIGPASVEDPCHFMERATGSLIDFGYRTKYIDDDTKYYLPYHKNSSSSSGTVREFRESRCAEPDTKPPDTKPTLLI